MKVAGYSPSAFSQSDSTWDLQMWKRSPMSITCKTQSFKTPHSGGINIKDITFCKTKNVI